MQISRRKFCVLGGAAVSALARPPAVQGPREPRSYYGGFRVGISARCFGNLPINQLTAKVTALGLKYLELSPAQADLSTISTPDLRRLRAQILDAGLSVHDYGVLQVRGKPRRRDLETIFARAEEFGFESLITDSEEGALKELDRLAGRFRVNVAVINHAGGFATADALRKVLDDYSERIGAAVDTGRFLVAGADPATAIRRLKDRIFAVRLTDVSPSGSFCPLGKGRFDLPSCLRALRESDYDGLLTLPCEGFPNSEEAIAESLEYLKKISGVIPLTNPESIVS